MTAAPATSFYKQGPRSPERRDFPQSANALTARPESGPGALGASVVAGPPGMKRPCPLQK